MRVHPRSIAFLALACAALAALLAAGPAGATAVGPACGSAGAGAGCCCKATTTVVKTASLGTTTLTSLTVIRATVRVTQTTTKTVFIATAVPPPRSAPHALSPADVAALVADQRGAADQPPVADQPAGDASAAPPPIAANTNGGVCSRCPAAGPCCMASALTATRTRFRTLVTRSVRRTMTSRVTATARRTATATVRVNAVGPWYCHRLAAARFAPLRAHPRSSAPACARRSGGPACTGPLAACCVVFASRGACEAAAARLSAQALAASALHSCPASFSLARTATNASLAGECGEARRFLKFWGAFGPVAYAFGGPQSARGAAIAAKIAARKAKGTPRARRARSLRRRAPPIGRRQAPAPVPGPRLEERGTFSTTGLVVRLVNQDTPTTFYYGGAGPGTRLRPVTLGNNECADIGAPQFVPYGSDPAAFQIYVEGKSGIGISWVKPPLESGWATLVAGTGPSCCFGSKNATGQWFYAFNPYVKDVPATFNKTYWTQQQQFMQNLPVLGVNGEQLLGPQGHPLFELQPNYRGLGDVCLHDNGTAVLGHPCQPGANPNVANVQFVVMHTGARNRTTGPFPPLSSPGRIWSRRDCLNLGAAPAGYPRDVNAGRLRGLVPDTVLGPAYRKLEPISDAIRVNMTMCTVANKPCLEFVGTLREASRKISSGEAWSAMMGYLLGLPGVGDQVAEAILEMAVEAIHTLTETLVDLFETLGESVGELLDAINAVDPDLSSAFEGLGENDLWDMVDETAATTDFRRSFRIFTNVDVDAVEGVEAIEAGTAATLVDDAAVDSCRTPPWMRRRTRWRMRRRMPRPIASTTCSMPWCSSAVRVRRWPEHLHGARSSARPRPAIHMEGPRYPRDW